MPSRGRFASSWTRFARTATGRAATLTLPPAIQGHRPDDDRAGDDLLDPVRQPLLRTANFNHRHDRGAGCRADYTAPSAEQATATDDDCGNDVQLEADGDGRVAHRQLRELHHAGERGESRGTRIHGELAPAEANTAQPRRTLARSDHQPM